MARRRQTPESSAVEQDRTVQRWASQRQAYLDNLKVLMIAGIIAGHGLIGYWEFGGWDYGDVREVTFAPVTEIGLLVVLGPFALAVIPLLFLVSGLLTPPSVRRKGAAAFVRDRLLRLGVPFAVFVLLLWPLLMYATARFLGDVRDSYWAMFLGSQQGSIDTGPLWFVGVLLVFSVGYAGWARARRGRSGPAWPAEVRGGHLLALAAVVFVSTFSVRLVFPVDSEKYVDLNLYQWPACLALFGLGVTASRLGWLTAVPERLQRLSRITTLIAVPAGGAVVLLAGALGRQEQLTGGWHWPALGFAAYDATLAVFAPVWLLGAAQRRLARRRDWGPVLGRSAYAAFMLQGVVLIGLAVALRPLPMPAEVKALLVAGGGVAGSFALAWLLISRVRLIARVL